MRTPYEQLLVEANARKQLMDNVREVLAYDGGESLFKNILRALDVDALPQLGLSSEQLNNDLGFMRATKVILDMLMEGDATTTTKILTELRLEKINIFREEQMKELERMKNV